MNGGSPLPPRARHLFARRLSRTSISKRLPVPPKTLADFPEFREDHTVDLRVRFQTHLYRMVCSTRKTGRYKKPVLSQGWVEFVRHNQLQVGDKVTLSVLDQDGAADDPVYLIEVERALVLSSVGQHGPPLPHTTQDGGAVSGAEKSPPALRGDEIKRLKLLALVSPIKEVDNTKPLIGPASSHGDLPWGLSAAYGPNINQLWFRTTHQATAGSADYDREEIKQAGPPMKLFGVPIYMGDKETARKLKLVSSTKEEINQATGELPVDLNSVPVVGGESGDEELDLTLKLGLEMQLKKLKK